MPQPPILRGALRPDGAIELLRELEAKRITGLLRFEGGGAQGEIALHGGEIGLDQAPDPDGRDPVDLLLGLREGTYEVHARLPPLAVSRGDDVSKHGSLAVHVPADLMSYCEQAGLTGVLELRHEGQRLEAIYDAGELTAIELDGRDDVDLSEVFGWEQGRFRIAIDPAALGRVPEDEPDDAPPTKQVTLRRRDDTGQFLRVVAMALVDVLEQSERARPATRSSPPMPPPPPARPRSSDAPPPSRRRADDQTVRLVYRSGEPSPLAEGTRAPQDPRERASTAALPERRPLERAADHLSPAPEEATPMAKRDETKTSEPADGAESGTDLRPDPAAAERAPSGLDAPPGAGAKPSEPASPLAAAGWALAFLALGVVVLALLARLPFGS